ncbi:MAG: ABC transporter ATP-binding protein [Calothrix sp. CSU_2_0]|nr:ABC transporter ATP-binding protein [Calothrix sp. CSU_2_0]
MLNLIELRQVSKTFRKGFSESTILQNIDLTIHKGEFVVLRGENGAGKSTLLNLILGLIKPSQGEVKLMGISPQDSASKLSVGVVLQETTIPKNVKVKELIQLLQSYYPQQYSIEDVLRKVKLEDKSEAWASSLSGGQKQRLYFALALVGNPELLILDEPTRNLDDKGYKEFWEQITACYQQGITI